MNNVNELLPVVLGDLFRRSKSQARADSIDAMQREMPKICAMLDLDPQTLKPVENVRKRA